MVSFNKAPFLEMSLLHKVSKKYTFEENRPNGIQIVEDIEIQISQFN